MANQELINYISGQIKSGDSKDKIKNALASAGWSEKDIADAFQGIEPASAPVMAATKPVAMSSSPFASPGASSPISRAPASDPIAISFSGSSAVSGVQDISPKKEPEINTVDLAKPFGSQKEVSLGPIEIKKSDFPKTSSPKGKKDIIIMAVLGLLVIAFAGFSFWLFQGRQDFNAKIASFTSQVASLGTQVTSLTKDKADLTAQVDSLKSQSDELNSEIALVAAPQSTSTADVTLTIKGTINFGTKYTVMTAKGIVFNVKNSKDAKVDAALKPLLGTVAELSGTRTLNSFYVTVTAVAGKTL